ncbi:MAG: substrate-binding domain-containing protein [Lachnospiraceae bacterium]|nr:substrate-binding domain-containing protein [Lachnospiraceae bacterium]
MKKGWIQKSAVILSIFVLLASVLMGCGEQTAAVHNKDIRIFLSLNEMDTFRQTLVNAVEDKAAQEGIELVVEDADGSIETQVDHIKMAAAQDYDVILCSPVSTDTVVELKASAGDIPMVFINSCPDDKHLEAGKYVYVGSDEKVAGQFQAEYVLERLADKDEINVVLLKGPNGHSATNGRTNGVKQTLAASGKKINYVFEDFANWDTEQAKELFELFLKTGVPVDCVLCNNDSMALGVVEACKNAGLDSIPVLGVDATADGCVSIRNGEMAFTVYQSGLGQGQAAVEMAMKLVMKEDTKEMEGITEDGKYMWVPFEKVDSSNVSQYMK